MIDIGRQPQERMPRDAGKCAGEEDGFAMEATQCMDE